MFKSVNSNNINNVLTPQQIEQIYSYIATRHCFPYSIKERHVYVLVGWKWVELDGISIPGEFTEDICVIGIKSDVNPEEFIIVNRKGEIVGVYPKVRYIADDLIAFEEDEDYESISSSYVYDVHGEHAKQGLMFTSGKVLFKGCLGNIDDIELKTGEGRSYLLLKKSKYTWFEEYKIIYYIRYITRWRN